MFCLLNPSPKPYELLLLLSLLFLTKRWRDWARFNHLSWVTWLVSRKALVYGQNGSSEHGHPGDGLSLWWEVAAQYTCLPDSPLPPGVAPALILQKAASALLMETCQLRARDLLTKHLACCAGQNALNNGLWVCVCAVVSVILIVLFPVLWIMSTG